MSNTKCFLTAIMLLVFSFVCSWMVQPESSESPKRAIDVWFVSVSLISGSASVAIFCALFSLPSSKKEE